LKNTETVATVKMTLEDGSTE